MIQKPPFSTTPEELETTDALVKEALPDSRSLALNAREAPRTPVVQKSKLSEEEITLGEEAFLNALIELEALGKTAAEVPTERVEKEQPVRAEIEALRRKQEQRIEEAHNGRHATNDLAEEQSQVLGTEAPPHAEGESERDEELVPPQGDHSSESTRLTESTKREADFSDLSSQTAWKGVDDLQRNDASVVVPEPLAETAMATSSDDLDLPAEVISRLDSDSSSERSLGLSDVARLGGEQAFAIIAWSFDEQSEDVRNAAARALFDLQPDRAASFARALREASPERRRRIGAALAASGLAATAIGNLAGQTREQGYEAFSLLFLMTKAGEVQPLLDAAEDHPNIEVRLTVVKLLALNGQAEILPSFRRLAVCGVLPSEVRAAVIEAIYDLGRLTPRQLESGREGVRIGTI